jgi:hypothetical protein
MCGYGRHGLVFGYGRYGMTCGYGRYGLMCGYGRYGMMIGYDRYGPLCGYGRYGMMCGYGRYGMMRVTVDTVCCLIIVYTTCSCNVERLFRQSFQLPVTLSDTQSFIPIFAMEVQNLVNCVQGRRSLWKFSVKSYKKSFTKSST